MKNERLNKVLEFATKAHAGQTRKGTNEPYINHPIRVAESVQALSGSTDVVIAAALLHDVLEDCPRITSGLLLDSLIEMSFTETEAIKITETVLRLSRPNKGELNIIDYLNGIKELPYARCIKMFDLSDNMSDLSPGNLLDKYMLCKQYLLNENH